MAALVCPATGVIVDATGDQYDRLVRAGFVPVEDKQPEPKKEPQRRTRKPTPTE
ncbi:hypothetical protein [uncultured Bifidobacterium sp.]|uniref:hypothetical protein n=1 Tax=uncultured Bifidobacterium sp. TaxID=165187 RepID=UPI0025F33C99|nr:hypothetical protein [uncultured Bifidobacterium sp.]